MKEVKEVICFDVLGKLLSKVIVKHLPPKSFKNKVMSNILQSYCSWVFFFPFIYLLIPCFL